MFEFLLEHYKQNKPTILKQTFNKYVHIWQRRSIRYGIIPFLSQKNLEEVSLLIALRWTTRGFLGTTGGQTKVKVYT